MATDRKIYAAAEKTRSANSVKKDFHAPDQIFPAPGATYLSLVSHRGFLPSHRERVLEHFIRTDEDKQDIYE